MGLKAPGHVAMSPSLSNAFIDPVPAIASFPGNIDAVQHSLATAGHHHGSTVGMLIDDGSTVQLICPVPPSVVYMKLTIVMQGVGDVSVDSTSNGTAKTWSISGPLSLQNYPQASYVLKTSGLPGDTATSPLKVRSSAAWTWTTEVVTITFTSATTGDGKIHAICFEPLWEAQSV